MKEFLKQFGWLIIASKQRGQVRFWLLLDRKRRSRKPPPEHGDIFGAGSYAETMPEIGKQFEIANYSTVGSVAERMKQRESTDLNFGKHLESIRAILNKSQERT